MCFRLQCAISEESHEKYGRLTSAVFLMRYKSTWHSNSDCNCCTPFIPCVGRAVLVAVKSWRLALQVVWKRWICMWKPYSIFQVWGEEEAKCDDSQLLRDPGPSGPLRQWGPLQVRDLPALCTPLTRHYTFPSAVVSKEQAGAEVVVCVCVLNLQS